MGDSSATWHQLQQRWKDEEYARERLLDKQDLYLDEDSMIWISNHIDCFVSQSRGNVSIAEVFLSPYTLNDDDDEVWGKVGQAVGNLQALNRIIICIPHNDRDNDDEEGDSTNPAWEILASILSHVQRRITLDIELIETDEETDDSMWRVQEVKALARAIHGHPTITSYRDGGNFPYESLDVLYSGLVTLPALESIRLSNSGRQARPEDESALAHHESLTELLRVPTLRSVCFDDFSFTRALCQATANAFVEGTAVTKLEFGGCSFSAGECAAIMANGLARNTSVSDIRVVVPLGQGLYSALETALPLNSTLRKLSFVVNPYQDDPDLDDYRDWSSIFSALENNTGLKTLIVGDFRSMDESLCAAMQNGLGTNETLESLEIKNVSLCDDNAALWSRALSFLRTNKALKSLKVGVERGVTESCLSAFCIDIVAMLQENTSLESLSIQSLQFNSKAENEYIALVTALQDNTTLKSLNITKCYGTSLPLTRDDDKQMAKILKKNYALESLLDIHRLGDVGAILRLNAAGRRYLIEDGSSIWKGVKVLTSVSNEINCVFLHLLENPRLCDRSAVEVASDSTEGSRGSANPANHNGKREQGQALEEGKAPRRRRT
jgi:hypothetical protein